MAVPSFHLLIPSVLRAFKGDGEATLDTFEQSAIKDFGMSIEDQKAVLPSGRQRVLRNRVGWAKWYLDRGGYVEVVKRGRYRLTDKGRAVLADPEKAIADVLQFRRLEFQQTKAEDQTSLVPEVSNSAEITPEEAIERAHQELRQSLMAELIQQVKAASPSFFEELVVELMLKMNYGGSRREAGHAVGGTGDGGIDGVISEDRLGLDAIYIQAKRWEGSVGEGPIRDFKGALDAKGAQKGVFITTSSFTPSAVQAAKNSRSYKIVLIDGERLAELMVEHNLGVSVVSSYQLKKIDSDFFVDT